MKQFYSKVWTAVVLLTIVFQISVFAQSSVSISGIVKDKATSEALPAVSINVKGKVAGTTTDGKGSFSLKTNTPTPFTLVISYIGFKPQEITIDGNKSDISIEMVTEAVLGQEVVVAASRVEEKILESPVSIERMGIQAIQNTPAPSFYDALANLKGVDMSTQSLTFKSVNTRGFSANGNVRFNQLIDGMDNQAPGLNFSVGNVVGMSELDVQNVELLPGASSALYGSGGTNGTLLMTSKSPFTYQGLSYSSKIGMMHVGSDNISAKPMYDQSFRYAHAFNNKFAFKINASILSAKDWMATNYSDRSNTASLSHAGNPGYDGINVYGDEISNTYSGLPNLPGIGANPLNGQKVSRTGYNESEVANYDTKSYKFNGALHYRLNESLEAIFQANYGVGSSVYTGADRYSLKDFNIGQYKLELKGNNFFVRGYTTRENSGDSYAAGTMASYINESWKPSQSSTDPTSGWFYQYANAYGGARAGAVGGVPMNDAAAHAYARGAADQGRFLPGSAQFEASKAAIISRPIGDAQGGAKFTDKSNMNHFEGMYNFSSLVKFVDVIAGASYRQYNLNSEGTLFADKNGREIDVTEYGAYGQISKKFLDDRIKLAVAGRYDKMGDFDGKFTPRVSGVFTVAKDNNIRLSYQTGYRQPTMQNQYIDLNIAGRGRLIGGLPEFRKTYDFDNNPVYAQSNVEAAGAAYKQAYTTAYVAALTAGQSQAQADGAGQVAGAGAALPLYKPYQFKDFGPESVQTYEIGYKGLIGRKLLIDVSYYSNVFDNFIGSVNVLQSTLPAAAGPVRPLGTLSSSTRNGYSVPVNVDAVVKSHGYAVGLDYVVGKFNLGGNVSFNEIKDLPSNIDNDFNTPKYKTNLYVGANNIVKNAGFNLTWRWQEKFNWVSDFADGEVPAYSSMDAQVNYKVPMISTTFKLGASNLFNKNYFQAYGNPSVGGMYYLSITFDSSLLK